jgi:hypothetical protein
MVQERMSSEEVGRRGDEWYNNHIRPIVETDENIGKLILIDVETGDYEIYERADSIIVNKRMLTKRPNATLLELKIGYPAVDSFGFRLMPSKR